MKTFLITTFLVVSALQVCIAQKASNTDAYSFLNNITFKNGKATVVVKGYHQSIFRAPDVSIIKRLTGKKKLLLYDYCYYDKDWGWEGSYIEFYPVNCTETVSAPLLKRIAPAGLRITGIYYFTCLVFKDEKNGPKPFFTVIAVNEKPPGNISK